jgi:hypothetical protein
MAPSGPRGAASSRGAVRSFGRARRGMRAAMLKVFEILRGRFLPNGADRASSLPGFARVCPRKPTKAYACLRSGPREGGACRRMFTNVDILHSSPLSTCCGFQPERRGRGAIPSLAACARRCSSLRERARLEARGPKESASRAMRGKPRKAKRHLGFSLDRPWLSLAFGDGKSQAKPTEAKESESQGPRACRAKPPASRGKRLALRPLSSPRRSRL